MSGSDNTSSVTLTDGHAEACRLVNGRTCVERVCATCGVTFWAPLRFVRKGYGRYCSRSCAARNSPVARLTRAGAYRGEASPRFRGWRSRNHSFYASRFRAKHPEKFAAHRAVHQAVRAGHLVKSDRCEICGEPAAKPLHGHHDDYSQPLAVRWVCRPCHRVLDLQRWQREHPEWLEHGRPTNRAMTDQRFAKQRRGLRAAS
jgi:hypothetical protein